MKPEIEKFFSSSAFAVVGASNDRAKYGNKVLRCYVQHHKKVYPVNPNEDQVEGINSVRDIADLPDEVKSLSIITPPKITEKIVDAAITKKIQHIWMQPGAENENAIQQCKKNGINVIAGGPCLLQTLGCKFGE